jgi:G8 domain
MVLDLEITPILNSLEIDGALTFLDGMNITLQSKIIFIRAGELNIGNATNPFTG